MAALTLAVPKLKLPATVGAASGYKYELRIDGELLKVLPPVLPASLNTPRERLQTARLQSARTSRKIQDLEADLAMEEEATKSPPKPPPKPPPATTATAGAAASNVQTSVVPAEWHDRIDLEPVVVFSTSAASGAEPNSDRAATSSATSPLPTPVRQQPAERPEVAMERRRVNASIKRAGLQIRRLVSDDGSNRFICLSATEGRLMLEAHRLGIEKRLKREFMTDAIEVDSSCLSKLPIQLKCNLACCERRRVSHSQHTAAAATTTATSAAAAASLPTPTDRAQAAASGTAPQVELPQSSDAAAPAAAAPAVAAPLQPPPSADEVAAKALRTDLYPAAVANGGASASSRAVAVEIAPVAPDAAYEEETEAMWNASDGRGAYEDFDLTRWEQFEPYRPNELLFTPMERQRLVLSILSAKPADGGAGIDTAMLLAGKSWRVPLSPAEEAEEAQREATALGFSAPLRPRAFVGDGFKNPETGRQFAVYDALFCVHSSRARFLLSGRWVTRFPPRVLGRPPLDDIREYFGEKIAFYFAFMHHYTVWLLGLAIPSLLALLLQFLPPQHVCPDAFASYMAGLNSSSSGGGGGGDGTAVKPFVCAGSGADNVLVPFYALASSLWAIYFFKYWRRYESALTYRWDMQDFDEEEPTRPEFHRHPATRHDRVGFYDANAGFMPFGDQKVPYFPAGTRNTRFGVSLAFTFFLMMLVAIGTLAIFALRVAVKQGAGVSQRIVADVNEGFGFLGFGVSSSILASAIASTLNTLFIVVFNAIYRKVGVMLTDWENHRTETAYENSLIQKNFAFQFVNSYISFFYIAFYKPLSQPLPFGWVGYDADGNEFPVLDECALEGCMSDLVMQMLVVVVGKQFCRNLAAACTPCCLRCIRPSTWFAKRKPRDDELDGAEKLAHEATLPAARGCYWEYNEMAIQFGYVTMFATAAPWASFLCLLNNAIERKADAARMLYNQQRPRYQGASSIGAWATVFQILSFVSIATNVAIVGVTSNSLETLYRMSPGGRVTLCIVLEHLLLIWKFVVEVRVPDAPLWVRKARAYQQWQSRRGLLGMKPSEQDAALLQAQYDDEDDEMERFWL